MTIKTKPTSVRKADPGPKAESGVDPSQQRPLLLDSFEKAQRHQETLHLIEEHQTQMKTQQELHEAKLRSIREQLQLQLFKIWNEVWLQRQKIADQAFKEWLKVFLA